MAELVAAVKSTYSGATSVRAEFTQTVALPNAPKQAAQKGRIALERPKKLRVDMGAPATQSILSDGSKLWFYDVKGKALTEMPMAGGGGGYAVLLDDLARVDEVFSVEMLGDGPSKGAWGLRLTPKTPGAIKSLELRLSKRSYMLEELVVIDPLGSVTSMRFSGVKMNQDIPDTEFVPPAGVKAGP